MTTEDDFYRAIDECPDDWLSRMVLADFFAERGDPREEGYRAMAALRIQPCWAKCGIFKEHEIWSWETIAPDIRTKFWWCEAEEDRYRPFRLPPEWFRHQGKFQTKGGYDSRRQAMDVAALAFQLLSPEQKQRHLAGELYEADVE